MSAANPIAHRNIIIGVNLVEIKARQDVCATLSIALQHCGITGHATVRFEIFQEKECRCREAVVVGVNKGQPSVPACEEYIQASMLYTCT